MQRETSSKFLILLVIALLIAGGSFLVPHSTDDLGIDEVLLAVIGALALFWGFAVE